AESIGMMAGDSIVSIAGQNIVYMDQLTSILKENANDSVAIQLSRNGALVDLHALVPAEGVLGFVAAINPNLPYEKADYGFWGSLPVGASKAWGSLIDNAKGLGKIFTGDVNPRKALAGPVGIAQMFGAEVNWIKFWSLVGLLSMALEIGRAHV